MIFELASFPPYLPWGLFPDVLSPACFPLPHTVAGDHTSQASRLRCAVASSAFVERSTCSSTSVTFNQVSVYSARLSAPDRTMTFQSGKAASADSEMTRDFVPNDF